MAALATHASTLAAGIGAVAAILLVLLSLGPLFRALGRLRQKDSLSGLTETRKGLLGLPHRVEEEAPEEAAPEEKAAAPAAPRKKPPKPRRREQAPAEAEAPPPPARPRPRVSRPEGLGDDAFHQLAAIADLCGRDASDVQKVLTQLAELLPSALPESDTWSCRIEVMESLCWSPGYVSPAIEFETPLHVGDAQVGSIRVGPAGEASADTLDETSQALLDATATLVNQMLGRRADRFKLEKLRTELDHRQLGVRQTVRLARIGAFEYEASTGLYSWSDELRAIIGIDTDRAGRERERMISMALLPVIEEALNTRKPLDYEFTLPQSSGALVHMHVVGEIENAGSDQARIVGAMRDVTEDREALRRLTHIANHDALTELPNRRFFQERIEEALRKRSGKGGLLIIDIDRFKDLNDTGGHDVGDMLLRDFGRRLRETAGNAFVARLGGDEFAVLLPVPDRMDAEHVARQLIAQLSGPLVVFGRSTSVQVSAGLAMFPDDGRNSTDLLKNADQALYEAKARGRNMLVGYNAEIRKASEERVRVCAEVRDALPEKQFIPYYQPKIHLDTGEVAGFEALVRWDHPGGVRTPGYFHAALDEPELSRHICAAMLDGILADMARWQKKDIPFGRIAFNASSSEFTDFDLAGHLIWRLQAIGISPQRIGVEVTEAVFLDGEANYIAETLAKLRRVGVETALDDFGTGFASLTHLQDFPIDVIKIDQSFIRSLTTDAGSRAITTAVLSLGRSLGKTVVAEGVETAEQAMLLKAARCDEVQGFYFGRPMPAAHVPKFLETWQTTEQVKTLKRFAA